MTFCKERDYGPFTLKFALKFMDVNDLELLRDCCRDQAAFEQMQHILSPHIEQQQVLSRISTMIRETSLDTVLRTTTSEVRQFLHADRTAIFRFAPNSGWNSGEFVAEDVLPGLHSALNANIHDQFGEYYALHFRYEQIQAIADIYTAGLQEGDIRLLRSLQIRANLVVPLLQGEQLWGLLCVNQCAVTRQWQQQERSFVQQVAMQLSIALRQTQLFEQTQQQATDLAQARELLHKSQMQLVHTEKMSTLGRLLDGIAQELSHPVHFIHSNLTHAQRKANQLLELLSLYQQECPDPGNLLCNWIETIEYKSLAEDFPKILSAMQAGTERVQQFLASAHDISQVDHGKLKHINIHDELDKMLLILQHRLKPTAHSAGIKIVKEYSDLPLIECYVHQIHQVLINLLHNAIDALEDCAGSLHSTSAISPDSDRSFSEFEPQPSFEPQITLRTLSIPGTEGETPRAVICITDNGAGIPHSIQSRLFDPFFTTKPNSTGLGLSVSHQIAVEHNGSLWCYSQPNQGAEFWLEIPIHQEPAAKNSAHTFTKTSAPVH